VRAPCPSVALHFPEPRKCVEIRISEASALRARRDRTHSRLRYTRHECPRKLKVFDALRNGILLRLRGRGSVGVVLAWHGEWEWRAAVGVQINEAFYPLSAGGILFWPGGHAQSHAPTSSNTVRPPCQFISIDESFQQVYDTVSRIQCSKCKYVERKWRSFMAFQSVVDVRMYPQS